MFFEGRLVFLVDGGVGCWTGESDGDFEKAVALRCVARECRRAGEPSVQVPLQCGSRWGRDRFVSPNPV